MREGRLLYLSRTDVEATGVGMGEIIEALERMFRLKGEGQVEMPPKPGLHPLPNAFIHAMPAYIPAMKSAGIKWVSGYPQNQARGLPYISGLVILNDPETGVPLAVMDCTWITGMRTGAATAVSAKYLARPDSRTLGILGCGVQGRTNLLALHEAFALQTVYAYDIDTATAQRYAAEMREHTGLTVEAVPEPRQAVEGLDLVVTAGPILKVPHATIQKGWLKPGAFASLVDYDSYWHPAALAEADKFCTDDVPQLEYYRKLGFFQHIPSIHADLGELAIGHKPGRQSPNERTFACNLGLALDDMATAPLVYGRAMERGVGKWVEL